MRKQDKIIIWPAYFDSTKTRSDGRRIPKSLALPSPKILEVKEAAEKLGLDYELVLDAGYPKTPWLKTGMLLVTKKETKKQIIKKIAKQLLKIRSAAKTK
ncbi:MAG: signal recognition particle subunit SRP19/SEC65 family protein [Candidatus Bathyarchaeales archaeon]